jgi:hypothetical protein
MIVYINIVYLVYLIPRNPIRMVKIGYTTFYKRKEFIEMQEANVEKYLIRYVKDKGGLCLKFISASMRGLPDRIVILPQGKIFFIELKAKGKKPRPEQTRVHKLFSSLGVKVYTADSKEKVRSVVDEVYSS